MFRRINHTEEKQDLTHHYIIKQIAVHHFQIKALIQDILSCRESMEALNQLNEIGRGKIADLREEIENLELHAKEVSDEKMLADVASQKHQMASTLRAFKEANIASLFAIEKAQREELLKPVKKEDSTTRNRKTVDKSGLLKMSTGVTDQLLSISRQLADTTQRSQDTLDSLVSSSSTVQVTQNELENTAGTISQSSKLLKKYGRREFTDKVIMFFAFLFFIAVVLYIIQKRLF